jgi:hypothetical protein
MCTVEYPRHDEFQVRMVADAVYPQPVYRLRYEEYQVRRRRQIARAGLVPYFYRVVPPWSIPQDHLTKLYVFVEYEALMVDELRKLAKQRQLPCSGTKSSIIDALVALDEEIAIAWGYRW